MENEDKEKSGESRLSIGTKETKLLDSVEVKGEKAEELAAAIMVQIFTFIQYVDVAHFRHAATVIG